MKENIKRYIPFAISGVTIAVTLILQFVVFSVNDKFVWSEFVPQLVINLFLLISTAIIWINSGTDRAKNEEKSAYRDNTEIYAKQIQAIVDERRLSELKAFCHAKTAEALDAKITAKLAGVGIDRNVYDDTLKNLSAAELKSDGYTRRQIRIVSRVRNGKIHVKPIRYMDLMSDSRTADDCGVNYDEKIDKTARISFRAVQSGFAALILAMLSIDPAQNITSISAWVLFFMRLLTIVWTAYSSEREGYARITETKNKVILRRIAFLHEFDEWASVPRLANGKSGS